MRMQRVRPGHAGASSVVLGDDVIGAAVCLAGASRAAAAGCTSTSKDPYVKRARTEGWRSRAVVQARGDRAHREADPPGMLVVDLGAAPGGWSQFAVRAQQGRGEVFAIDILPMPAIAGVDVHPGRLQGGRGRASARCGAGRAQGRPCAVRHGPQHERHRCDRPAARDASRGAGPGYRQPCLEAEGGDPDQGLPGRRLPGTRRSRATQFRQGHACVNRRLRGRVALSSTCWRGAIGWCRFG